MDPSGAGTCMQLHDIEQQQEQQEQHANQHDSTPATDTPIKTDEELELEVKQLDPRRKLQLQRDQHGWRKVVRNFTPSWFFATMGTGIVSILLYDLPYNGAWLYWISVLVFTLNIVLFIGFFMMSAVRYIVYPDIWSAMIRHPVQSLFLGTIPIGLSTIIDMIVFVCVPAWGSWTIYFAWTLWWIDVVLSLSTCFCLPFIIMYLHETKLSTMTAVWLLPIVAPVVAAASGGIVADVLPNPQYALWTITISYVLWGTGIPLAMAVLVIYFQRLTVYKLPPREVIVSVFLPLGPLGLGGFAVLQLGKVAMKVFPLTHTLETSKTAAGDVFYVMGWMIAIIMWGFGLVWLFFALASITRSRFPFNMGWWGFTFPLGVFAVSTTAIGKEMPSRVFDVLGTIFSVCVVILWIVVSIGTVKKLVSEELLVTPCLKDIEVKEKLGK